MPVLNNIYTVYIEGIGEIGVYSIEGLEMEIRYNAYVCLEAQKVIKFDTNDSIFKSMTLKWAVNDSKDLYEWLRRSRKYPEPKNIMIALYKTERELIAQWMVYDAIPIKYMAPNLNALGEEVAMESLQVKYLNVYRIK